MTAEQLYGYLNARYPLALRAEWDHDGRMCLPLPEREVRRVLLALDVTPAAVETAIERGCDGIVAHHPLLFRPLEELYPGDRRGKKLLRLCEKGCFAFCFHTRLDAACGGVNDRLAARLGLQEVEPFSLDGIEMGRIGRLPKLMGERETALYCKEQLGSPAVTYCPAGKKTVSRVAILGGAGSDAIAAALALGADGLITGDIHYNPLLDAAEDGLTVYRCGHFETEQPVLDELAEAITAWDPTVQLLRMEHSPTVTV